MSIYETPEISVNTLPKLAIIGRPNVGKSALFNRIAKKRIAIVDEAEGVTRDRLYAESDAFGFPFIVIDTGGIDPKSPDQFGEHIRRQAEIAIAEADRIVMVVDALVGITALDRWLVKQLHKHGRSFIVAVNKIDSYSQERLIPEFYSLGVEKVMGVSALHGHQIADLLESVWEDFEPPKEVPLEEKRFKISIIGRPNVGKSTLINALLQEERCVVSEIPGTTRDHVKIPFEVKGNKYELIDTAGIRRKKSEKECVDKFAYIRTQDAIAESDLCILVLDAQEGVTAFEKRIATMIEEAGCSCILLLNKWDLVGNVRMEHAIKAAILENPFLAHCPMLCISAKAGRNLKKIFPTVEAVAHVRQQRVTTGQLNKFLERAVQLNHPPFINGKRLRIYYLTQVGVAPPTFVLFVNHPSLMGASYERYLINQLRKNIGFPGTPIRFFLRGKFDKNLDELSE